METVNQSSTHAPQPLNVELLGKPIHIIRDKLHELLAASSHTLTNELQNWLGSQQVAVKLATLELHNLDSNSLDKSLTSCFRHQQQGLLYLQCDSAMLIKLADRFYGASIEREDCDITSSDLRLQRRMAKLLAQCIAPEEMWQSCEFEFSQGVGLYATLQLQLADQQASLALALDSQLVNTLINELELTPPADLAERFQRSLTSTPVRLNALLSRKTLPLSQVLSLQPNDIIPIEMLASVPVSIGNQRLFNGRVAEQDDQLVLIINSDKES
ncbi:FliM/FliN family flagellar motor switch protein [Vibrio sp.]|uniref:FliM/FliN family flagellar motor switch protein n=1 Tax=Vibrio sp. TaxID=678 RepID=UPI003D131CA9